MMTYCNAASYHSTYHLLHNELTDVLKRFIYIDVKLSEVGCE